MRSVLLLLCGLGLLSELIQGDDGGGHTQQAAILRVPSFLAKKRLRYIARPHHAYGRSHHVGNIHFDSSYDSSYSHSYSSKYDSSYSSHYDSSSYDSSHYDSSSYDSSHYDSSYYDSHSSKRRYYRRGRKGRRYGGRRGRKYGYRPRRYYDSSYYGSHSSYYDSDSSYYDSSSSKSYDSSYYDSSHSKSSYYDSSHSSYYDSHSSSSSYYDSSSSSKSKKYYKRRYKKYYSHSSDSYGDGSDVYPDYGSRKHIAYHVDTDNKYNPNHVPGTPIAAPARNPGFPIKLRTSPIQQQPIKVLSRNPVGKGGVRVLQRPATFQTKQVNG